MNVHEYINLIDSILARLEIFCDKYSKDRENSELNEIVIQLNFIKDVAKSGRSFKQALIERKKFELRNLIEKNPISDEVLRHALRVIYDDLEAHDYNAGRLSREMSLYFYEVIIEKSGEYEKYFYEKNLRDERLKNNYVIAYIASNDLRCGEYYGLWIKHGIKNLQYFFFYNVFSFTVHSHNEIQLIPEEFEQQLNKDIERIAKFYETDEAEGTHMYLNPVEIKEVDGVTHLLDLKGNIVA